jgi:hypothetical protein
MRRLKLFDCALDLLRNTNIPPTKKKNPNGKNELVYRFRGETPSGKIFYVQAKENKKRNKYLMSVFPDQKQKKPRK